MRRKESGIDSGRLETVGRSVVIGSSSKYSSQLQQPTSNYARRPGVNPPLKFYQGDVKILNPEEKKLSENQRKNGAWGKNAWGKDVFVRPEE